MDMTFKRVFDEKGGLTTNEKISGLLGIGWGGLTEDWLNLIGGCTGSYLILYLINPNGNSIKNEKPVYRDEYFVGDEEQYFKDKHTGLDPKNDKFGLDYNNFKGDYQKFNDSTVIPQPSDEIVYRPKFVDDTVSTRHLVLFGGGGGLTEMSGKNNYPNNSKYMSEKNNYPNHPKLM